MLSVPFSVARYRALLPPREEGHCPIWAPMDDKLFVVTFTCLTCCVDAFTMSGSLARAFAVAGAFWCYNVLQDDCLALAGS